MDAAMLVQVPSKLESLRLGVASAREVETSSRRVLVNVEKSRLVAMSRRPRQLGKSV